MRIVYCTRLSFLDPTLPLIREMSAKAEVHLVLEMLLSHAQAALFGGLSVQLAPGLSPADPVLRSHLPEGVCACWQNAASFHLIGYSQHRTLHPATLRVAREAGRLIRSLHADVVHLDEPELLHAGLRLGDVPLVLAIHDPAAHSGEADWHDTLARRLTFGRARRFIVHNRAQRDSFCATYRVRPEAVDAVPLGVYDVFREWITRPLDQDVRTVLFFGRLSPYKGLEVLYKAAPQVASKVAGVRFVIAGQPLPGYQPPVPPQLTNGGHIDCSAGYVPNARLAELFQRATVVVCPYTDATQSGVVLTAYAFDRPVVATRTGGLPEYVDDGHTGLLVPPSDPVALADALIRILTDEPLRRRLQTGAAQARTGELSWSRIASQTIGAYSRALEAVP